MLDILQKNRVRSFGGLHITNKGRHIKGASHQNKRVGQGGGTDASGSKRTGKDLICAQHTNGADSSPCKSPDSNGHKPICMHLKKRAIAKILLGPVATQVVKVADSSLC